MSLTNPNTPVSQQDLQDFYHKILPYMGNSFAMIANKFSKGDLYSTDEKMIGQWIDSKPLYQKVFSVVDTGNSVTHTITIPSTLNIESVVYFKAEKVCDGYGISIPYTESNHAITVSKPVASGDIVFTKDTAIVWSGTYYLTMKYTKTTDSAISIGSDTDYSTEEKIVGTWIDGSPVYQRTITLNNYISFSQKGSWTNIVAISGLTVNKLISCVSMYRGDGSVRNASVFYRVNGGYLQYFQKSDGVFTEYEADTFTIQYTKTS